MLWMYEHQFQIASWEQHSRQVLFIKTDWRAWIGGFVLIQVSSWDTEQKQGLLISHTQRATVS